MEDEEDYESLPTTSTMSTHMLAGAAAGIMEHALMYPVDCVKTRMMTLSPDPRANYRSVSGALLQIIRTEGPRNTLRGIQAMVGGAGPAHALYFACYEKLKKELSGNSGNSNPGAQVVAGAAATVLHDAVMNPAEVIKQRMQVYGSPYRTCIHCGNEILKKEGRLAFYRSYTTQLSMNIPFQCIHFVMYEFCQERLNHEREYKPMTHILSGSCAGAIAAAATTPLDVCKTLLNTQEKCATSKGNYITGLSEACRTVYQFRGVRGFFSGLSARVIFQTPSTGISWAVYELFKHQLTSKDNDGYVAPSASSVVSSVRVQMESKTSS